MARLGATVRSSKSIAGAALVGFGMFVVYENLAIAVAWLSHVLGANGSEALGIMPNVILAVAQALPAHAVNHQHLLQGFLKHVLLSSWPLLLVMLGTVLSRESLTDEVDAGEKKDWRVVDLTASRSTLK